MRKMNKKLKETIDFHIKDKMLLRVERLIGNEPYIEGFPISLSEKFLLITCINDFHDEGYTVLRTKDIKKAYSKESIDFYEEMCKKEGLDEMIKPVILDLSGFAGVFSELKNHKGFIAVECEEEGGGFYLGKITAVDKTFLRMLTFDPAGRWSDEEDTLMYDDITRISFGDHYSKTFYKYMR